MSAEVDDAAGALAGRLMETGVGVLEMFTLHLGLALGLYEALRPGPLTPPELARATGTRPRYAREWLEQQVAAGLLGVVAHPARAADGTEGDPDARVFALPPATAAVLVDPTSPFHLAAMPRLLGAAAGTLPRVVHAWREGRGLSFAEYGDDVREAQGALNRPGYQDQLVQEWVPAMPGVGELLARPGARALDLGCGLGFAALALARGYDTLEVVGVDSDEASVGDARQLAAEAGLTDRVRFEVSSADADLASVCGGCDVVLVGEALHDMAHPVQALASARSALREGGCVVVLDTAVADAFTEPGPDGAPLGERLAYASSVLHCLPVGLSEENSAGTGAVMRPFTLRRYACEAGFGTVETPEVPGLEMLRAYLLRP